MKTIQQEYSSKDTSVNTVSAVYTKIFTGSCKITNKEILDYGGGKYDSNAKYMKLNGNNRVLVYDPYNRTYEHNQKVLHYFECNPAEFVVCSNVLNVIKEDEVILNILRHINSLMIQNGLLYISIYERNKSGVGYKTTKGWQRNQRKSEYIPFITEAFNGYCQVCMKSGIIEVQKV